MSDMIKRLLMLFAVVTICFPFSVQGSFLTGIREVVQDTHDDLNTNANIQISNTDVNGGNPVPVSFPGGVTVTQTTHDNLNANANIQVGDVDVSGGNPVPVDGSGVTQPISFASDVEVVQPTHDDLNSNANIQIANSDVSTSNAVPIKNDSTGNITVDLGTDNDVVVNGRWGDGAGEVDDVRIDAATNALQAVDSTLHQVHAGNAYLIRSFEVLADSGVFDIQITTPNTTKWAHFSFSLIAEHTTTWEFYENVTINVAGTTIPAINRNRNSANTTGLTIKGISNTSTANANSDTAISSATLLAKGFADQWIKHAGINHSEFEIILDQNKKYTLRFTDGGWTANDLNFHLDWYEFTDIH